MTTVSRAITGIGSTLGPALPDVRSRPQALRFNLSELNGGLGDIGVMAPIVAVLIADNGFSATSVLLVFGVAYCFTGLYFGLPVPVQPLKAMSAIAIAQGLSPGVVSSAGLIMAAVLLFLAFSGLMRPLASLFTRAVVRGIQFAVGLMLLRSGLALIGSESFVRDGPAAVVSGAGATLPLGLLLAAVLIPAVYFGGRSRVPVILLLLPPALVAGAVAFPEALSGMSAGPETPSVAIPSPSTLMTAAVVLVLPQLPLTLGNAVVASTDTAHSYYGPRAERVSHRSMLVSKGIANTFAGVIGGMPVCHGSGGFTAHYRFGARTGGATVMLGTALIVLALAFGSGTGQMLALIPLGVVGALLAVVGLEHALLAREVRGVRELAVVAVIAGTGLAMGNLAIGFGAGIALDLILGRLRLPLRHHAKASLPATEADPA